MAAYDFLKVDRQGPVAWLTLNRPQRRNALTQPMMLELERAFGELRGDTGSRVVVLRGEGGHFCAGGDLGSMANVPPAPAAGAPDPLIDSYRQFGRALLALESLPQATIAVVEGSAVGGGLGMACCSDLVVLHADARLGIPEPKVGFIPSQILPFLVRRMGEGAVRDLAVSGRVIDGREAHRLGVGRHLCASAQEVEQTLHSLIDDVLKMEPVSLAAAKRLVLSCSRRETGEVLDDAAATLATLLRRPEATEGIRHFLSKTSPSWAISHSKEQT